MEDSQATTLLSSPTEATSVSAPRFKTRARKRSSWTAQHMLSIKEGDASKRRCAYCHLLWSSSTSSSSIAKHLLYPMTLHWVSLESSKPTSVILDFLDVFPGM